MKYIFIINNLGDSHWRNRVEEFVNRGFDVCLYAYSRNGAVNNYNGKYEVTTLADFSNTLPYVKRLNKYFSTLPKVQKKHAHEDVCYYLFGLDTAMIAYPFIRQPYIYEEFDLVHTYIGNRILRGFFDKYDKLIIHNAKMALFTSEGFVKYHFGERVPSNVGLIPNKLNPGIVNLTRIEKSPIDINHIRFAFVGGPRFKTIANFAKVIADRFPQHEMHFYGRVGVEDEHFFTEVKGRKNVFFHGFFKNPDDLPVIYSKIDVLLSTYDADFENVRYAEPNKIYESLYFETPIIVSSNTFLADKVKDLGIGWDINSMNDDEVERFVNSLSVEVIKEKEVNTARIDKKETLNINDEIFNRL